MSTYDLPYNILKIYEDKKEEKMSQIPDKKYPKNNQWGWVDSQLGKLMKANTKLREENKELKEKYDELHKSYTEGTPASGYKVEPYVESIEEPEGEPYTKEEIERWEKHLKESGKSI